MWVPDALSLAAGTCITSAALGRRAPAQPNWCVADSATQMGGGQISGLGGGDTAVRTERAGTITIKPG
jgi:hypothetical protein